MQFEQFLKKIDVVVSQPLFALDAHLKMAPIERVQYLQNYDYSAQNPKASAVLSLFYPKNGSAHLLLIVRSSYPGVHSSQIAFPYSVAFRVPTMEMIFGGFKSISP